MDLTQLANLGEFIGGVAVLMTLVYLAVQRAGPHRYLEGVVSKEMWTPHERIVMGLLRAPFTRKWWATEQNLAYTDRFRAFVNQRLGDSAEPDSWRMTSPDDYAHSPS